jgi:chromosome segregation ATPase
VSEVQEQVHREIRQEQEKADSLVQERQHLERQLNESQMRLSQLRDDRRVLNLEGMSVRQDRQFFANELEFLKRISYEEEDTVVQLRQTNEVLGTSSRTLEVQTEQLERQRKDVVDQVTDERSQIRNEEHYNNEVRGRLERLRREQIAVMQGRQHEFVREMQRSEMQNTTSEYPPDLSLRRRPYSSSALPPSDYGRLATAGHKT